MSDTQSSAGTIDGVSYSSTQTVYDTLGYGVVTEFLYFDQTGKQVAERGLYYLSPTGYGIGAKTVNSDGTFSFEVTNPGSHGGFAQGYSVDTFSSAGIWIRDDVYTPIYIYPSAPYEGISGYSDSYTLVNAVGPGSSGTINGSYYDMVESQYDAGGHLTEKDYLYDLNGASTLVAKQVYAVPNPVLTLPGAATATAGTALALAGISLSDDWAAINPGTLALIISTDSGTVSGTDTAGNPYSASAGKAAHLTGSLGEINADLSRFAFTGQTGTAHVTFHIYDQAGAETSAQETITVSGAGSTTAPDPVLTGSTQLSATAGTALALSGIILSDPWASTHAGTLALNVATSLGTLNGINDNGQALTGSGTAALHAVGTLAQINADLADLLLTSSQAGTANVRIEVYDQAGIEAVHVVGVTVHATT